MQKPKLLFKGSNILVGITVICVILLAAMAWSPSASPQEKKDQKPENTYNKMPVAVYTASESTDPKERAIRQARSSLYDRPGSQMFDELPPDTTAKSKTTHWWVGTPALPTAESDAVVIGKVTDAKGYLSNDRTSAYSEYTIRVKEVLKSDGRVSDGSIIAEREGAIVKLPSGREIIDYGIATQGKPLVRRQYVLFLKYNEAGRSYHIITGYELRENKVISLDQAIDRFAVFNNFDQDNFLNEVRAAVANPPQAPEDRRRVN